MPHDLPPWEAVYQQTQRWLSARVFEAMVHDLRMLLRLSENRAPEPTAAILDSRTLRSTPESGSRGGYDGAKRLTRARRCMRGGGHFRTPARLARQPGLRTGARARRTVSPGPPRGHGRVCGTGLCGSRLHRGASGQRSTGSWHLSGGSQARRDEARLRAAATSLGCGARFRVGIAISAVGQGLREATYHFGGLALCRVRLPLSPAGNRYSRRGSITRSRNSLCSAMLRMLRT
jgi:transposase